MGNAENTMRFYVRIKDISIDDAPVKRALWGTFRGLRRFRIPKKLFRSQRLLKKQIHVLFDSFLRQTAELVAHVPYGTRRRQAILSLQAFVGVLRHCSEKIFAVPEHEISRHCKSFVLTLTQISVDDRQRICLNAKHEC
ncbi:hypothetical protein PsorP6_017544 [Peronosclerospora sorghi]|uniref:Uncharacterized protein n=1 Tax=Peronosclerospora sorghi TaxID=230839 RepID=A0ACC0WL20_9STRA|nr:hypothetical protein PsorP6_017544 [Peronosclerospora sorghi]